MISWWFPQCPNLNQWLWHFNGVDLFLTPSLSSPWTILSSPSNDASVCVCVGWGGALGAFSLDTSLEVWNTCENILPSEFHSVTRGKNTMKCKRVLTDLFSPGRCRWCRGVILLACCLARALVFSAYGCHVLPPRAKWVHCHLYVYKAIYKITGVLFCSLNILFFFWIYVKDKGEVILL